jgi:hypothetical protein
VQVLGLALFFFVSNIKSYFIFSNFILMKKAFLGGKKTTKPAKKGKDILKMSKKELAAKAKELDQTRDEEKLGRVSDKVPGADSAKGCFVRNVMHKCANGTRTTFKIGEKLDPKHPDFDVLKKHLA